MSQPQSYSSKANKEFIRNRELRKKAQISEIDRFVLLSELQLLTHKQLESLLSAINAALKIKQTEKWSSESIKNKVRDCLQEVLSSIQEFNRFDVTNEKFETVIFSPDGSLIASSGASKTVKVWSREGLLLATLEGHTDWVNSLSFSPQGNLIVSASSDHTVRLWSLDYKPRKPDSNPEVESSLFKVLSGSVSLF